MNQAPWQLQDHTYLAFTSKQRYTSRRLVQSPAKDMRSQICPIQSPQQFLQEQDLLAQMQPYNYIALLLSATATNINMVFHCKLWVYSRLRDVFPMHSVPLHNALCIMLYCRHFMSVCLQNVCINCRSPTGIFSWTLWSQHYFCFER